MTTQPAVSISRESNIVHLPFVYFLPEDLIERCPTLYALPRKVREVIYNEEMMVIVNSDQFMDEIMDAVAHLVFPHFGFRGWKEHYTADSPVWKLTYLLGLWSQLLEFEFGWDLNRLLKIPSSEEIPFFDNDYVKSVIEKIVKIGIERFNLQPILDVCREMPCDEDFENFLTYVRIDFYRKWYHSRSERVQMVPFEECLQGSDEDYYSTIVPDNRNMAEFAASEDYCRRFKERLSKRDRVILELREDGFTFEEIAERLEYKNHSGVVKRIQVIRKEFIKYQSEQQQ